MARIYGDDKLKLSYDNVVKFFEDRAKKSAVVGDLSAVIYQDKNPELAINRDIIEKNCYSQNLELTKAVSFLMLVVVQGAGHKKLFPIVGNTMVQIFLTDLLRLPVKNLKVIKMRIFLFHLFGKEKY